MEISDTGKLGQVHLCFTKYFQTTNNENLHLSLENIAVNFLTSCLMDDTMKNSAFDFTEHKPLINSSNLNLNTFNNCFENQVNVRPQRFWHHCLDKYINITEKYKIGSLYSLLKDLTHKFDQINLECWIDYLQSRIYLWIELNLNPKWTRCKTLRDFIVHRLWINKNIVTAIIAFSVEGMFNMEHNILGMNMF